MREPWVADEVNIDASLVGRLVSTQFPQWADLPIKPIEFGGWDNRTFHLGERMTVRLPSAARYSHQVEKEQRWLPRLAPFLPLPIPVPLAMGDPAEGYPFRWSVYCWLDGETAAVDLIPDLCQFATALAEFLATMHRIDTTDGPPPGPHNFYRGGPLTTYDAETRHAIAALDGRIDTDAVTAVWEAALAATWRGAPVWFHGDVSAGNLLVDSGRLSAVIDFGMTGVGDPACDLSIAWTLFGEESRDAFRATLPLDAATWARGRGWALWKALIKYAGAPVANPLEVEKSRQVLDAVVADHCIACKSGWVLRLR
jgi:aminoglycoside phosphotransferase (APT) family kinase protein